MNHSSLHAAALPAHRCPGHLPAPARPAEPLPRHAHRRSCGRGEDNHLRRTPLAPPE
ncbi:MAG: hypothetical protein MZV64_29760 [Ignavibacteriales bacterium]|nr:hypothetical protein [Ignavibacteriales bacterium]